MDLARSRPPAKLCISTLIHCNEGGQMKSRAAAKKPGRKDFLRFANALLTLKSAQDCEQFLGDLCTPAELEAMVDRWRVVEMLKADMTYRDISEKTGISVTTVGRVARCLEMGQGGYQMAWDRTGSVKPKSKASKR